MSGRDGTNLRKSDARAKVGSLEEYLSRLRKKDPAAAKAWERELAERRKLRAEREPLEAELLAAAHELAEDCGLDLSADGEGLSQRVLGRVDSLTPRQLRGLFTIFGQGAVYFNDLNWGRHRRYGDEVEGTSSREIKDLTRQIRRAIEPQKRSAS